MKKIFLLLLVPICSWAQFGAGNKFIGGTMSLSNQNNSNSGYSRPNLTQSFSFNPSFGFLVKENLAIGIRLGYSKSSNDYNGSSVQSDNFGGGFFVRRYFSLSEKFVFAIDGGINYSKYNLKTPIAQPNGVIYYLSSEYNSIGMTVTPTFIYFPSTHWGIEAALGSLSYYHNDYTSSNYTSNVFNLNYGSFSLGFAYYFRKNSN